MAAGGQQLLRITPEKVIEFAVVPYRSASAELVLCNISSSFVAFKVKTTAPKSYLVRPSTGIIAAGNKETVHIVFQASPEDNARASTDRFLIQSTAVQSSAPLQRDYWQTLDKDKIEDARLSVVFRSAAPPQANFGSAVMPGAAGGGNAPPPMGNEHLHTTTGLAGSFGGGAGASPGAAGGVYQGAGGGAATAASGAAAGGSNAYSEDLKTRYDNLVDYALALERHKEDLIKENEALKQQLNRKAAASHKSSGMGFFELWHFPVYVFIGVIIWYLLGRSSDNTATKSGLSHRWLFAKAGPKQYITKGTLNSNFPFVDQKG